MKNIIKKNRLLFLVVAIVLLSGAGLAAALVRQVHSVMAAEQLVTTEAEAAKVQAAEAANAGQADLSGEAAMPKFTEINTTLSADAIRQLVSIKEMRRGYIIPSLGSVVVNQADTWQSIQPPNLAELREQAFLKTAELAKALFDYELTDKAVSFDYYTDTSKHRPDFVRITTSDDTVTCTLSAGTLDLIEIDYFFIPASEQTRDISDSQSISEGDRQQAGTIAALFDSTVAEIAPTGGMGGKELWAQTYALKLANGKLVQFAVMNGTVYAVGVYPSEASMQESVYFDADVQIDSSLVRPASERDFRKGEPGADDMGLEEAQGIYGQFFALAGGDGQYDKPKATFYLDHSGKRENYWHMEGKKLTMDLSSKSKWIVSLTCDDLWNPAYDLTGIPYDSMGGKEYAAYVGNIMGGIYGADLENVEVNAVYDYHYCTEYARMADGTVCEFFFKDGKLQEVFFYTDEECWRAGQRGWRADHEYVNAASGETFVPN